MNKQLKYFKILKVNPCSLKKCLEKLLYPSAMQEFQRMNYQTKRFVIYLLLLFIENTTIY